MARRSVQDFLFRWLGDTDDLERASNRAQKALGQSNTQAAKLDKGLGIATRAAGALGLALGAREIGQFALDAIDSASDLNESINAVQVATGDSSDAILAFGRTAATAIGMSQRQVNEAAVAFSAFNDKIGGGADTFQEYVTRAGDFASVMNLEMGEALEKFQSGLAGESESLRGFGIDVSAAATQTFAYANGIAEAGTKLTEAEKIQARYGLILQQTEEFAGDFANTSDELANQQRIANAEWENSKALLGEELIPLMTTLTSGMADMAGSVPGVVREFKGGFAAIQEAGARTTEVLSLGLIDGWGQAEEAAQDFNRVMMHVARRLNEGIGPTQAAAEGLANLVNEYALSEESAEALRKELGLSIEQFVEAVGIAGEYAEQLGLTAFEVETLEGITKTYADTVARDAVASEEELAEAAREHAFATKEAAEGTGELAEETDELDKSLRKLVDPIGDAEDAIAEYDQALQDATEDGEISKEEAIKLAEALIRVEEAAGNVTAENVDAFKEALVRTGAVTEAEAENIVRNLDSINRTEFVPAFDELNGLIGRLEEASSRPIQIDFTNLRFASRQEIEREVIRALQELQRRGEHVPI